MKPHHFLQNGNKKGLLRKNRAGGQNHRGQRADFSPCPVSSPFRTGRPPRFQDDPDRSAIGSAPLGRTVRRSLFCYRNYATHSISPPPLFVKTKAFGITEIQSLFHKPPSRQLISACRCRQCVLLKRLLGLLFLNWFSALIYGYLVGSEMLCFLPEALLSCVDKKVSRD